MKDFEEFAKDHGDPRASNFKAAVASYLDPVFRDDAATLPEVQTNIPTPQYIESILQVVEGKVLVPDWYRNPKTAKKSLVDLVRMIIRLQYSEYM